MSAEPCDLRIQVVDLVAEMVEAAPLISDETSHGAALVERFDQLDPGAGWDLDKDHPDALDRVVIDGAHRARAEQGLEEVLQIRLDRRDRVADVVKSHVVAAE
jgi:hypothetical protein